MHQRRPLQEAVAGRALDLDRRAVQRRPRPSGSTSWPTKSGGSTTRWTSTPTRSRSASPTSPAQRLRAQLGPDVEFEFVWIGPYQYRDHLLDTFRVGRTIFVGDAAHVVCPFGARGGNNGIQDAGNLGWKLALVVEGKAGEALVDSYTAERHAAAVENLRVTSRTARFLAPRSAAEHRMRRAVVALARNHAFARKLANTGRMAQANEYPPSPWAPDGARSLQNVALGSTTVMGMLAGATRFLGLWPGAGDAEVASLDDLARRLPIAAPRRRRRLRARAPPRRRAADLGARPARRLRRRDARGADAGQRRGGAPPRAGARGDAVKSVPNIADADAFYEAWIAAHEGLSDAESADLDARLVLVLANQVGELQVLLDCIAAARRAGG